MWIVRVALQRPYTFIMLAVLIVFLGVYSILKMPTDIFPNIKIPIAAVIWRYTGLLPEEIANRIVLFSERTAQTVVNDVEHTESQSVNSEAVVKYFFQPNANQDLSMAQIIAVSQTQLQSAPPGTTPPFVLSYNASSVPILQLALSSETIPEQEIFDLGNNILRTQLATVAGASIPYPYGGKQREVQVDLDPRQLRARGLAASDVVNAIGSAESDSSGRHREDRHPGIFRQAQREPHEDRGAQRSADQEHRNGGVLYVRDVAHVRDGYPPQTNIARVDGKRAIVMNVLEDRQCLDARHHQRHQPEAALRARRAAEGSEARRLERSVDFRARRDQRRHPGRRHRRCPHRAADSAVPRQLAQHADHHHLDSAVDPGVGRLSRGVRGNHQYHDLGRPRALGRHPGR